MILSLALFGSLVSRLDAVLDDPALDGGMTGVYVCRPDGTVLYEHDSDTRLMPASNQKILSVYYALSVLGRDWFPRTKFYKQGENIVVDAEGDPLLSPEQLKSVRAQLGSKPGTRVYVQQAFSPRVGPGWESDDLPHAYAARVTAFTVDGGRFFVSVKNRVPEVPAWSGVRVQRGSDMGAVSLTYHLERGLVTVNGALPKSSESLERFALPDPAKSAALLLGGQYFRAPGLPASAATLILNGKPMSELAKQCLEPSDNMLAEHLLLMAAHSQGDLGEDEFSTASERMTRFYVDLGIAADELRPQDGSGLSRHDLVTPRALAQVLRHAWSSNLKDLFLEALPKPGEGTLRGRLSGKTVYAKTGTLDSASCLSGYAVTPDGPVVFSIMMNHFVKPASQIRGIQDKIVSELFLGLD